MKKETQRHSRVSFLITVTVWVVLTLGMVEAGLRLFDPIGVLAMQDTRMALWEMAEPHPTRGYTYVPEMRNSYAGEREPRVAFVGDSLTYGWGVPARDTFVVRLAEDSDCTVLNTGHAGYNVVQVLATVEAVDADYYVYLHYENDAQLTNAIPDDLTLAWSAITRYSQYLLVERTYGALAEGMHAYWQAIDTLAGRDDVLIITFEGLRHSEALRARHDEVVSIPLYRSEISVVDSHPSANGHAEITESMRPYLGVTGCWRWHTS